MFRWEDFDINDGLYAMENVIFVDLASDAFLFDLGDYRLYNFMDNSYDLISLL